MHVPRHAALVRVRSPDGTLNTLAPGDIIGRSQRAALMIDDGRISEAHALVSLRGDALRLLSLRGRFALAGRPLRDLELAVGQRITLADGITLEVAEVVLPRQVLALESPTLGRRILQGPVTLHPGPRLAAGYDPDGVWRLWSVGRGWRAEREGMVEPLEAGRELELGTENVRAVLVDLAEAARHTTLDGGVRVPLHVEANFDTVHIRPQGRDPLVLGGLMARLISELVVLRGPASWRALARELWPDADHDDVLRRKWDVLGVRLRAKLRKASIRTDLVRPSGTGQIELLLYPDDTVVDGT